MAAEFRDRGVAVQRAVAAHRHRHRGDRDDRRRVDAAGAAARRKIVADAAHWILTRPARETTGNFFLDDEVLRAAGVTDLDRYAVEPGGELYADFFLD